jgi:hypothetical protein
MLEPPGEAFERCPRCRMRRDGYSVFRCPSCGLAFCAGCDRPDLPVRGLGWLEAAAAEVGPVSCPVCTAEAADEDRIGFIAGPEPSDDDTADPGPAADRAGGSR